MFDRHIAPHAPAFLKRYPDLKLSFNFTARDLFNTFNTTTIYETPQFRERSEQDIKLRAFYIGLTWNFGGPRRPQGPPKCGWRRTVATPQPERVR